MDISNNKIIIFDLDDTLYKEIEYVKSAYYEIAEEIAEITTGNKLVIFDEMLQNFHENKNVFNELIKNYNLPKGIEFFLRKYRSHRPQLSLSSENLELLNTLKSKNFILGLLTDGRSLQQRNKIKALNIGDYFDEIVISEEFGSEKPDIRNFKFFEEKYKNGNYFYVGDNLSKDFLAPNLLGWKSICLKDDGCNIHRQDYNRPLKFLPQYTINSLKEILNII